MAKARGGDGLDECLPGASETITDEQREEAWCLPAGGEHGPDWSKYKYIGLNLYGKYSHIRQDKEGDIRCEVEWWLLVGDSPRKLVWQKLNLLNGDAKARLAKALQSKWNGISYWWWLIDETCDNTIRAFRTGDPIQLLDTEVEARPPQYIIYPFWPKDEPTILFGFGGTGKSYMGLMLGVSAQVNYKDNALGFRIDDPTKVLYLDWETSANEIHYRTRSLRVGMGLPPLKLAYRKCLLSLADDIGAIGEMVREEGIGAVIIDSVALACGGNLREEQQAIEMFRALRQLPVSSLLITHQPKDQNTGGKTTQGSPFGSVYYVNYARSVWQLNRLDDEMSGGNPIRVALKHTKVNNGPLIRAQQCYEIHFGQHTTQFRKIDSKVLAQREPGLAQQVMRREDRILALVANGALSSNEIIDRLGEDADDPGKVASIRSTLSTMARHNKLVCFDGRYGLASSFQETEPLPF